jgi:hypothetical protein
MAIDSSIALGVRPLQLENPLSMYGTVANIQNAQNQNALAQYTLAAARRGEETENALNKAYMEAYNPQTGQIDLPTLRGKIATAGVGSKLPAIEKQLAEVEKEQLARKEQLGKVVNQRFDQSKALLANVRTPEEYIAWHEANHADPVLGEYLKSRGVTAESSRAQIMAELAQPNGLQRLIARSATALDKMPELLEQERAQAVLGGRKQTQPVAAPVGNALVPTVPQAQPVANAMVAPVQTAAVPTPAVTAIPTTSGLQNELIGLNNEIARLQGSESAGLGAVQARIKALEEQKARIYTAINQATQAETSAKQANIASFKLTSTPEGVVKTNILTGETELVRGPDGKPMKDVAAAQAAEAKRHAGIMESQGASRIQLERTRADLERQRVEELKNDKVVANTVTDEAGNVRQYNRYGEQIGETKAGAGKPSASFTKLRDQRAQLGKDLGAAINELTEITKDGGLIDQSTGSGVGRLVDVGKGFFGGTTPGAIATAKLKPIQDLVLKTIPRFEGPQSDKDTQSYKEAAGQLADPNMPTAIRKEAAKTVLRLMTARKNQFVTPEMAAEGAGASGGGVDTNNPLLK